MPNIQDVAKLANVSRTTVSRVLNDSDSVKRATRMQVLAAIDQLNYQPNHFSRSLRLQKSNMFLILMPNIASPSYGNILRGMDDEATQHGYSLLIVDTQLQPQRELSYVNLLETKQVDGAVFLKPTMSESSIEDLSKRFPIVQCCEYYPNVTVPHVSIDNYAASYAATKHLISSGHKRIAFLSSANNATSTVLREKAYEKALKDHGIPYDPELILQGSYLFDSGVAMTKQLLSLPDRPTAIFSISDIVAAGSIRAALDVGLKIPDDIAIIGFDNTEFSRMLTPPMSTVAQPLYDLGKAAIHVLISKINGSPYEKETFLPFEVIIRDSTN